MQEEWRDVPLGRQIVKTGAYGTVTCASVVGYSLLRTVLSIREGRAVVNAVFFGLGLISFVVMVAWVGLPGLRDRRLPKITLYAYMMIFLGSLFLYTAVYAARLLVFDDLCSEVRSKERSDRSSAASRLEDYQCQPWFLVFQILTGMVILFSTIASVLSARKFYIGHRASLQADLMAAMAAQAGSAHSAFPAIREENDPDPELPERVVFVDDYREIGRREGQGGKEEAQGGGVVPSPSSASLQPEYAEEECCVCFDFAAHVTLLPCHHRCTCIACTRRLRKCPLCRADIVELIHYRLADDDDDGDGDGDGDDDVTHPTVVPPPTTATAAAAEATAAAAETTAEAEADDPNPGLAHSSDSFSSAFSSRSHSDDL